MACLFSLCGFLLTVNKLCKLECQDFLSFIELCALPAFHLVNFLERKEGEHSDTFKNIGIRNVSPVLEELERCCLVRIKPYCTGLCLAHLLALRV